MDDATVDALGKLSEALEVVEAARGFLYQFHRMSGMADLTLQDAVSMLRAAGHDEIAERIDHDLVGRNVVDEFWTYEIVERYDDQYWSVFRAFEADARTRLPDGERHGFEARMKRTEQSGRNV